MTWERKLRATHKLAPRFVNEFRRSLKAFRLSRCKNQQRVGVLALHHAESNQCERLFGGHDAACDYDGRAALPAGFRFEPARKRRGGGKLHIVLKVSADRNALAWRAQSANALRVLLALHQERARVSQRRL